MQKKSLFTNVVFLIGMLFLTLFSSCKNQKSQSISSTVYLNGKITTMTENPDGSPNIEEAVMVKDGKIFAVGTKNDVLKLVDKNTMKVDLNGKTLLPGFIDSHSHILSYAQSLAIAQLQQAESFDDIIETMKDFLSESHLKPGEWLIGFGYDHNSLKEKEHPTKEVLDLISKDIPIAITHKSGHMGVMNSKALELCGIDESTENPAGGLIGREKGSNIPSGYLEEKAFMQLSAKMKPPAVDFIELINRAENNYFKNGVTTTQEAFMTKKEFAMLQPLFENDSLKIDIVGYVDLNQSRDIVQQNKDLLNVYKNHFKIGGYKIFLDGSPQGRTAWLTQPYLTVPGANPDTTDGDPNYRGYAAFTDAEVEKFIRQSLKDKMSLHAHCNGDAAADQFINIFNRVLTQTKQTETYRPTMIHTQIIRPEQFAQMAKLNMIPSIFVAHIWYWGDIHLANLGSERAMIISATNSALKAGTKITFHQDTPVIEPDMMETIWCAVNRISKGGVQFAESEKITPYQALQAITTNGAYEIWEESSKGTIEKGKRADLVVLDKNPLDVNPFEIKSIKVIQTIKDGKTFFTNLSE